MIRTLTAAALIAASLAAPAAFAGEGEVDAAAQATLTAQLQAEGYEVRQFKAEDGLIEVYVVKDGEMEERWFDASLKPVEHEEGEEG